MQHLAAACRYAKGLTIGCHLGCRPAQAVHHCYPFAVRGYAFNYYRDRAALIELAQRCIYRMRIILGGRSQIKRIESSVVDSNPGVTYETDSSVL